MSIPFWLAVAFTAVFLTCATRGPAPGDRLYPGVVLSAPPALVCWLVFIGWYAVHSLLSLFAT